MKIIKPAANAVFTIAANAVWPSMVFETDLKGPTVWSWSVVWMNLRRGGSSNTAGNVWDATSTVTGLGGTFTVTASAKGAVASVVVKIKGSNPTTVQVDGYLAAKPNAPGFNKIIAQETKGIHFTPVGEPVRSFDNGYGICQLTTPPPTYEQIWNWKANVDAGVQLFAQKRTSAIAYLTQAGRSYTQSQLVRESICRWNGGAYHVWDAHKAAWVRPDHILCDTGTGNIGWDLNDPANSGKTAQQLHSRDAATYGRAPATGSHWKYIGVCYADHLLG